jgi:hypothetical protein
MMHKDELIIDATLAQKLIDQQIPKFSHLTIEPVDSWGTDNTLFKLGSSMVVRLARVGWAVEAVQLYSYHQNALVSF